MLESNSIFWVEIHKIAPNPFQPRRDFNEENLKDLADSIRMYGILQPLTVTRKEVQKEDGGWSSEYELIAGERRLRAAKLAGLEQVPVIIRSGEESDRMKLELAIIENLQREDLNPIDRAYAFKQLTGQFGLSHSQIGRKVGRSRMYVSNTLRLLNLPEELIEAMKRGDMTEGHGRALLMLSTRPEEQHTLFRETLLKKLSVRDVERISRKIATDRVRKKDWGIDPELIEIEKQFTETLGTRVQISRTDFGGKVTIDYFSPNELRKLLDLIEEGKSHDHAPAAVPETIPHVAASDATSMLQSAALSEEPVDDAAVTSEPEMESEAEKPVDDRSTEEKHTEEDPELYAIKNFSI